MIEYKNGDILAENVEALVNSVNCVGVMGRGIALQFKKAYPSYFKAYADACKRGEVQPGRMFVFETNFLANPRYIINFPTKRHWRGKSRMSDIEAGLEALVELIKCREIRSIAIPPLGSGLGGLNWVDVRSRIESVLEAMPDLQATVFEPSGAPDPADMVKSSDVPNMTPGRAALIGLMDRYIRGLLDPFVTLLELHKLMYFMQEAGEPLKLRYVKGPYGPYAENLRHVLKTIEGHMVSGYADGGDAPAKELEIVPGTLPDASVFLRDHPDTLMRFQRVSDLVDGFETPFGLELLSTVHWVVTHNNVSAIDDIVDQTYRWSPRKRQFSKRQIGLALHSLLQKNWLRGTTADNISASV